MTTRNAQIAQFLTRAEVGDWRAAALSGDASTRSYQRLTSPDAQSSVLLMDWPPSQDGDTGSFVEIAARIRSAGLSAPRILAEDREKGLLLLEDFGDDLFTEVMRTEPDRTEALYQAAVDLLIQLQGIPAADLDPLEPQVLSEMTRLAFSDYRYALTQDSADPTRLRFERRFAELLQQALQGEMVFVHRDFHAQNLLWLPDRAGVQQVGVIDFQDAKRGHPAYDLVSLLQDARRDVSPEIEHRMIAYYTTATGADPEAFHRAYTVIGVQRNMRILGIFARLAKTQGKRRYVDLIPRVWGHFIRGLDHPALAPVAEDLRAALPAPDEEALRRLRA